MKQIIKFLIVFMLPILILVPPASAWTPVTHQNIASGVYHSLPSDVQQKLDLNEMQRGSIAPDTVFHDGNNHRYSKSSTQANKWLKNGKSAYKKGDYKYASYCYGVALHYITDTFSAPHSVTTATKTQHEDYENQGTGMTPAINPKGKSLRSGYLQGKKSWKNWAKTRNTGIVQSDLNNAASAAYSMIKKNI